MLALSNACPAAKGHFCCIVGGDVPFVYSQLCVCVCVCGRGLDSCFVYVQHSGEYQTDLGLLQTELQLDVYRWTASKTLRFRACSSQIPLSIKLLLQMMALR